MKKDIKEIANQTDKELLESLKNKKAELFKLRLDKEQIKLKNTRSIYNTRKEIARIMTLIKEKELAAANKVEAVVNK